MGYNIEKVLMNKLSYNHIWYFIGVIAKGPKGGIYYIDEFNCEKFLKIRNNTEFLSDRTHNIMVKLGKEHNKLCTLNVVYNDEKELIKILERQFSITDKLCRNNNKQLSEKILMHLDF